jgi:hypothetical protein
MVASFWVVAAGFPAEQAVRAASSSQVVILDIWGMEFAPKMDLSIPWVFEGIQIEIGIGIVF